MMRVVVLGQPGQWGSAWCRRAARGLAQRLELPCISAADLSSHIGQRSGWVATAIVGACSEVALKLADTAVWLHFSPVTVLREWFQRRQEPLQSPPLRPRIADLRECLRCAAQTHQLLWLLRHPLMAHLQVFHLRSPSEAEFWLRIQEHRPRTTPQALAKAA